MKSAVRQLPQSFAKLFGFFILALMIASGSCRFNKARAQEGEDDLTVKSNWCNVEYLQATHGDNWHIIYALHGCWMEPAAAPDTNGQSPIDAPTAKQRPIRFAVRGR